MPRDDVPKQVRVRTDPEDGLAARYDAIEAAATRWDCNKTEAIVRSCEVAGPLLANLERALEHEDLPPRLAKEIAEEVSTRGVEIDVDGTSATVETE